LIRELEKIFQNFTVLPLSYLAYYTIEKYPVQVQADMIDHFNGSMLLPTYAQLPKYIAPLVREVREMFQFKENVVNESQKILHTASKV
jgi:hypothetical protein